jgi:hypothetical protein
MREAERIGASNERAAMRTERREAEPSRDEVKRRKDLGELALWEKRNRLVRELALE